MANLTLVAGKIGLSGSTGGGAAGHRVVRNDVRAVVANAAANFSVVWLGQLWSLILLTSALLPKSLYPTKAFGPVSSAGLLAGWALAFWNQSVARGMGMRLHGLGRTF